MLLVGAALSAIQATEQAAAPKTIILFDGTSLDGWIDFSNVDASLNRASFGDLVRFKAFSEKILNPADPVSRFLNGLLSETIKHELATINHDEEAAVRTLQNNLARELNRIITSETAYDAERFRGIALREETKKLLEANPVKYDLARLNKLLIEDAYDEIVNAKMPGWVVEDEVIASTGAERGVLYTKMDFEGRFRIMFDVRHAPGRAASVLLFCIRPEEGERPLDALAGIQFQVPRGHHWDYRPGKNNDGGARHGGLFVRNVEEGNRFSGNDWARVEILADATKGTARMAVAQPIGSKAVEILTFNDPTAARVGPFGLQVHHSPTFDWYRNITVELNPEVDDLITTR
jgi:hypothetical protein